MFNLHDLEAASELVYRVMPATPQYAWPLLARRYGTQIVVKHENHLPTGAMFQGPSEPLDCFETRRRGSLYLDDDIFAIGPGDHIRRQRPQKFGQFPRRRVQPKRGNLAAHTSPYIV